MKKMLRFELKKIFSKTVNKIVLLVLLAVLLAASFLTINGVRYVEEDGSVLTGISAARKLQEEENKWKGELTEEVFEQVLTENQKINAEAGGIEDMDNQYFYQKQSFYEIRNLINDALVGYEDYDYYRVDYVPADEKVDVYGSRLSALESLLETKEMKEGFSEKEKQFLIRQWEELDTPFYYEYAGGWKAILEDSQVMQPLLAVIVVVLGFLVSGIFSDEFQYKADAIYFSSRLGRNKAVLAKIGAGILTGTIVYWGAVLFYTLIVLTVLGVGGGNCPIQISNWKAMYNLTYFQEYLLVTAAGYVGSLFILMVAMLVSAKTRSTVIAITIPFALACAPMFIGRISIFSHITNFLPDMLLRICVELDQFLICEIGGKVLGLFTFLIPLYLVLYILGLPVLYQVYRRVEVK